jgi:hypothetical protein
MFPFSKWLVFTCRSLAGFACRLTGSWISKSKWLAGDGEISTGTSGAPWYRLRWANSRRQK